MCALVSLAIELLIFLRNRIFFSSARQQYNKLYRQVETREPIEAENPN